MKTLGLIGGIGWESTAVYYRLINQEVRNRRGYSYGIEFLSDTTAEQSQAARLRELLSSSTGNTKTSQ